jgi:hypothetical protein
MSIKKGTYKHYKNNLYRVLDVATHSESLDQLVVYKPLYGEGKLWVRPIEMFNEEVVVDGKSVKRFTFVES